MSKSMFDKKAEEKFDNLLNMYGEPIFRCAIAHLLGLGYRHFEDNVDTDEKTEKYLAIALSQIEKKDKEAKEKGNIPVMSVDFQMDIIKCAIEISHVNQNGLLEYVSKKMKYGI